MNRYQAKLAAIKARRLSWPQRLFSILASLSLLCGAVYLVPMTILVTTGLFGRGYSETTAFLSSWDLTGLIINILAIPALLYLIYFSFSWCLKHLVRCLSGIKEST